VRPASRGLAALDCGSLAAAFSRQPCCREAPRRFRIYHPSSRWRSRPLLRSRLRSQKRQQAARSPRASPIPIDPPRRFQFSHTSLLWLRSPPLSPLPPVQKIHLRTPKDIGSTGFKDNGTSTRGLLSSVRAASPLSTHELPGHFHHILPGAYKIAVSLLDIHNLSAGKAPKCRQDQHVPA
jgi:hypothetical protein